jgi:hypothetical protein
VYTNGLAPCDPKTNNPPQDCDVTLSTFTPSVVDPSLFNRGLRVTWGESGTKERRIYGPPPTLGVEQGDHVTYKRNRFQIRLSDRPQGAPGDFDLELNYDDVTWEHRSPSVSPRTLIGVKVENVLVDLGAYYSDSSKYPTFIGNNDASCDAPGNPTGNVPFDPAGPFVCNSITVRFVNGAPALESYTADLRVLPVVAQTSSHSGETTQLGWTVQSSGPHAATAGKLRLSAVPAISLVTTADSNCVQIGGAIECELPVIAPGTALNAAVPVRYAGSGELSVFADVTASQFDPNTADNQSSMRWVVTGP